MKLFIAIDDTDNKVSIGTGRLSRMLADELKEKGLVSESCVTRHQLLVHPDIPYTSHNSSACIDAVMNLCTVDEVSILARAFLEKHFHEGANPGLSIAAQDCVPEELPSFGRRAQEEVIPLDEAKKIADRLGIFTWWSGETGQGCIGAMSAIGLRSTNNDGRYIALDGIREIGGMLSVREIIEQTAIDCVTTLSGESLVSGEMVDTQNWVRPILKDGLVTLEVIPVNGHWRAPHKKKPKKKS
jgi:tRNA(Ile2) C34 agmatinyltransferase TiaS